MTTTEALVQDHTVTTIRAARENPDRPLKYSLECSMTHTGDDLIEPTLLGPDSKVY